MPAVSALVTSDGDPEEPNRSRAVIVANATAAMPAANGTANLVPPRRAAIGSAAKSATAGEDKPPVARHDSATRAARTPVAMLCPTSICPVRTTKATTPSGASSITMARLASADPGAPNASQSGNAARPSDAERQLCAQETEMAAGSSRIFGDGGATCPSRTRLSVSFKSVHGVQ